MKKKISLVIFIAITLIIGISSYIIKNQNKKTSDIKVIAYKESEASYENSKVDENLYTINKFENINSVGWINENTVLTLKDKPKSFCEEQFFSIYDLTTKEYKDFQDVSVSKNGFLGISDSGKYVLYGEDIDNSNIKFHQDVKILNIEDGEVTTLIDEEVNCNAQYRWISDDKIFVLFNNSQDKWQVLDIRGQVVKEGKINYSSDRYSTIVSAEDIIDLGDSVEGKFYYTKYYTKSNGLSLGRKVYSMDVNSQKEEVLDWVIGDGYANKNGNCIVMDFYNNNGDAINGVYINRTFGLNVFALNGQILQSKELEKGKNFTAYSLSTHGNKLAYAQSLNYVNNLSASNSELNKNLTINIMNIKNGVTKEIANMESLIETNLDDNIFLSISNLVWNEDETALIVTCKYMKREAGNTKLNLAKTNTYVVKYEE